MIMTDKSMSMNVRNVPEEARKQFRLSCMQNNVSMQKVLISVMAYLADPDKLQRFLQADKDE